LRRQTVAGCQMLSTSRKLFRKTILVKKFAIKERFSYQ